MATAFRLLDAASNGPISWISCRRALRRKATYVAIPSGNASRNTSRTRVSIVAKTTHVTTVPAIQ
jgi:hypothetical protein